MENSKGGNSNLSSIEIEIIVEQSVRKTLTNLGIDLSDTKSLQAVQADFIFMRRQRRSAENLSDWIKKAAITVLVGGALAVLWQGVKMAVTSKTGGAP